MSDLEGAERLRSALDATPVSAPVTVVGAGPTGMGAAAELAELAGDAVRLDDGRELPSAVTIWTAGFRVPDLAARSGLRTDTEGRLATATANAPSSCCARSSTSATTTSRPRSARAPPPHARSPTAHAGTSTPAGRAHRASGWRPCGRLSAPTRCSVRLDDVIDGVLAFRVENARVTGIYYVRNPEKLTRVESETPLTCR